VPGTPRSRSMMAIPTPTRFHVVLPATHVTALYQNPHCDVIGCIQGHSVRQSSPTLGRETAMQGRASGGSGQGTISLRPKQTAGSIEQARQATANVRGFCHACSLDGAACPRSDSDFSHRSILRPTGLADALGAVSQQYPGKQCFFDSSVSLFCCVTRCSSSRSLGCHFDASRCKSNSGVDRRRRLSKHSHGMFERCQSKVC